MTNLTKVPRNISAFNKGLEKLLWPVVIEAHSRNEILAKRLGEPFTFDLVIDDAFNIDVTFRPLNKPVFKPFALLPANTLTSNEAKAVSFVDRFLKLIRAK